MKFKFFLLILISNLLLVSIHTSNSQESILQMIENNWNQIQTMSGSFSQINADDTISYGRFYFSKPHKSKFIYENNNETIITTKSLIVAVDDEGYKIESYPIYKSPIKNILESNLIFESIDMNIDIKVNNNNYLLLMKNIENNTKAIFSFDKKSIDLKKWEIIDEFNQSTVLEFTKIKKNISISPETYSIKYKQ